MNSTTSQYLNNRQYNVYTVAYVGLRPHDMLIFRSVFAKFV